jgi:hypothetical protein
MGKDRGYEMKAERLAEIRERRDDQPWLFSGMIDELIDALTAERARAEKTEKQRDEILRLGSPYPLASILEILPVAMNHLLSDHGCDHHGYETWMAASQAAVDLRSNLEQPMEDNK